MLKTEPKKYFFWHICIVKMMKGVIKNSEQKSLKGRRNKE